MNKTFVAMVLIVLLGLLGVLSTALQQGKDHSELQKKVERENSEMVRKKREETDRKQRKEMMEAMQKGMAARGKGAVKPPPGMQGLAKKNEPYLESDWAAHRKDGQQGLNELTPSGK